MRSMMPATWATRAGRVLFLVGDCLFLTAVSCTATVVMHMMHSLEWGFMLDCVGGMILGMLVAMLMAFAVAPLLGSIESMTPSMVVAMLSPMSICVLDLFGWSLGQRGCLALGGAFGVGMFVFVQVYGLSCRKAIRWGLHAQGEVR